MEKIILQIGSILVEVTDLGNGEIVGRCINPKSSWLEDIDHQEQVAVTLCVERVRLGSLKEKQVATNLSNASKPRPGREVSPFADEVQEWLSEKGINSYHHSLPAKVARKFNCSVKVARARLKKIFS